MTFLSMWIYVCSTVPKEADCRDNKCDGEDEGEPEIVQILCLFAYSEVENYVAGVPGHLHPVGHQQ